MENNSIHSCHLGPGISPETFIHDHFFLYMINGRMTAFDGHNNHLIQPGDACIARKNHLIRYTKTKEDGVFGKVVIVLEEAFLRKIKEKHHISTSEKKRTDSIIRVSQNTLLEHYVHSLEPYYKGDLHIEPAFADLKREELLLVLMRIQPELTDILFDFSDPEKVDLKAFMNVNFRFNISLERFAFLTGRSLSAFKRDFADTFHDTPGRWLTRKRLDEAWFLLKNEQRKPGDVYPHVGFEDLSHFSFAFKKQFGVSPSDVGKKG